MASSRVLKTSVLVVFAAVASTGFAQQPKAAADPAPTGQWVKLNDTLDTGYAREGDKIGATLQGEATLPAQAAAAVIVLPKGTKLTGKVVRSVQQSKLHPHSGLILLFDQAELKDHRTVAVKAVIRGLAPSHSDEIEKISVGSGDVTDANMTTNKVMGNMLDANTSVKGATDTGKGGERYSSSILGVMLFAAPVGEASGIVVAASGPLHLEKFTRMNVVLTAAAATQP